MGLGCTKTQAGQATGATTQDHGGSAHARVQQDWAVREPLAEGLRESAVASDRQELAKRFAVTVVTTDRGLVRGDWGHFEPLEWLRDIVPEQLAAAAGSSSVDGPGVLRRLLIACLELQHVAKRAAMDDFTAERLGDGSFGSVWRLREWPGLVAKVLDKPAHQQFELDAARLAVEASERGLGPRVFGTGWVHQTLGGRRRMMVTVMEALHEISEQPGAVPAALAAPILARARAVSQWAFHNDLLVSNLMARRGEAGELEPVVIDFDLADERRLKLAVTSSCIVFDFDPLFGPMPPGLSARLLPLWREYCDLFLLSCSISGTSALYGPVLARLAELFEELQAEVLGPLFQTDRFLTGDKKVEVPFEVCVRAGEVDAVTVNLGDLAGNAFAHRRDDWERYPAVIRSNGVYWPQAGSEG